MPSPIHLVVQYPNRRALLASARTEGGVLSLFVPRNDEVRSGSEVTLDITVERTSLRFNLRGEVRLLHNAPGTRQGMGVNFVGEQKRAAAQMVASCAGRSPTDGTALDSRREVDLRCLVNLRGQRVKAAVKDVSSTGAFIGAAELPMVRGNTELTIQLNPFLGLWGGRVLKARVIWVGEKNGVPGFGVRFLDATAQVRESLKKLFS